MYSSKDLRDFFSNLPVSSSSNKFIVDLQEVSHIDSSGIAAILQFGFALRKLHTKLRLLFKKEQLVLLHYFKLDTNLGLHSTLESALDSFYEP